MSPLTQIIVAIDDVTKDVICAVFLRELPQTASTTDDPNEQPGSSPALIFGIYGLWTIPTARRRGIALAVLEETKIQARRIAQARGGVCLLEVEAYDQNLGAIELYQKAGFVASTGENRGMVKLSLMFDPNEAAVAAEDVEKSQ